MFMKKQNIVVIINSLLIIAIVSVLCFNLKNKFENNKVDVNKAQKNKILKDISHFNNTIEKTNERDLPPPDMLNGYGIRLFNDKGNLVKDEILKKTSNNKYMYYLSIANANEFKDKIGLVLFINGKIHPFSVDGNKEKQIIYMMDYDTYTLANIPISFEVNETEIPYKKNLIHFTIIKKIDKINNKIKSMPFFANGMDKYIINDNSNKTIDKTQVNNTSIYKKRKGLKNNVFRMTIEKEQQEGNKGQTEELTVNKGEKVALLFEATSDKEGVYSTIVFIDNKPLEPYMEKPIIWKIKNGQMLSDIINIKMPEEKGNYEMYAITIYLNEEKNNDIYSTDKFTLKVK